MEYEFKIGDKIKIPITKSTGNYDLKSSRYKFALGDAKFGIIERIDFNVYKVKFNAGKELLNYLKRDLELYNSENYEIY
jgi:hypothetical protein